LLDLGRGKKSSKTKWGGEENGDSRGPNVKKWFDDRHGKE